MLKGRVSRGGVRSRERGGLNISGISESIASSLSEITDILPELD